MISTAKNTSSDLFQQAMGSFETALRAGMKLQEDSAQQCVEILRDVGSPLEWERTVPARSPRPSRPCSSTSTSRSAS